MEPSIMLISCSIVTVVRIDLFYFAVARARLWAEHAFDDFDRQACAIWARMISCFC